MSWFKKHIGAITGAVLGGPAGAAAGYLYDKRFNKYQEEGNAPTGVPQPEVGSPEWYNMQFENDPLVKQLMEGINQKYDITAPELGTGLTQQMLGVGQRQADIQAGDISSALASRGGGGIGSALAMGAQARASAATNSMAAGIQADLSKYASDLDKYTAEFTVRESERDQLMDALTFKYNILTQIMSGKQQGQATLLDYKARREMAKATKTAGYANLVPNIGIGGG